jgi:hypothetical protein
MTDYNNFGGYFPNGFYRDSELFSKGRNPKLIQDLDSILEDIDFDVPKYQELKRESFALLEKLRGMGKLNFLTGKTKYSEEEEKMIEEMSERDTDIKRQISEMIAPVYDRMRKLGYTHEELTV